MSQAPIDSAPAPEVNGFHFDYASLLACAWGRPSDAFGPMYARFDGTRRVARLPGPPYHFMSRVTRIDGELGLCKAGASIEIAYDVPPDAWYFDDNGHRVMPFCILLEMVLQPCGWLASYVGSALIEDEDLKFRNLDGCGRVLEEISPNTGTVRTVTTLTNVSHSAGMILQSFRVRCYVGDRAVYELDTGFGFFPSHALENQVGLATSTEQRALLDAPSTFGIDLCAHPPRYFTGSLRLAAGKLRMLDRITACDESGGAAGLGFVRGEKDIDTSEWFFKAHFFQDPVQPGSLGIEAMLQLLQFFMMHTGMGDGLIAPRFEAIALAPTMTWKYRGQVIPTDRLVSATLEITERGTDATGPFALAKASLWVDGKRIYEATQLGMRIVGGTRLARHEHVECALAFWRKFFVVPAAPVEDLYRGLGTRFFDQVHIVDRNAFEREAAHGVLFLANHQTAVESTLFAILASALVGSPTLTLAKKENADHWLFRLMQHSFTYPGLRDPGMTLHFDRSDPASLPGLIKQLGQALSGGRSVMVHVEGTRSLECRTPVRALSGSLIEMALEAGRPIVPVRFTGGLPSVALAERTEFPVGMGRQDCYIGAPISMAELAPLNYGERRARVLDAINSLGPSNDSEQPSKPDPAFESAVHQWMSSSGAELGHAATWQALRELDALSPTMRSLIESVPSNPTTPEGAWIAELARRLCP